MSTFGTLQTVIADEINKTNLGPQIRRAIVASMRKHRDRRFRFNYVNEDITLTASSNTPYAVANGYIGEDVFTVVDQTNNYETILRKVDYDLFKQYANDDNQLGQPRYYSIINTNFAGLNVPVFRVYPVQDRDYIGYMSCHVDLNAAARNGAITASASDAVTNNWMTDGFDLIRVEAKIYIYNNVIRGQESKMEALALQQERNDHLKTLVKEYQKTVGSGNVQSSDNVYNSRY